MARQAASSLDAMTDWKNVQVFWMHAGAAPAAGLASYVTTYMPHAMRYENLERSPRSEALHRGFVCKSASPPNVSGTMCRRTGAPKSRARMPLLLSWQHCLPPAVHCSHPKGRCLLFRQVAAEKIQLIHLHAQLIPTCSPIISQRLDLTSQKAEGLKEGFSLEANALTGADAAMLPCITRQAIASEHP